MGFRTPAQVFEDALHLPLDRGDYECAGNRSRIFFNGKARQAHQLQRWEPLPNSLGYETDPSLYLPQTLGLEFIGISFPLVDGEHQNLHNIGHKANYSDRNKPNWQ
jgi:hypothetical protein